MKALREAAASAQRSADIAKARYEAGAAPYIELLDAQRTLLQAQDSVAASSGNVVSNLIRLYKAVGGGWSTDEEGESPDAEALPQES